MSGLSPERAAGRRAPDGGERDGDRLRRASLGRVPEACRERTAAEGTLPGIAHLGVGAFHRAHQAVFTEDAVAQAGGDWGIVGIAPRGRDLPDRLAAQDHLFSVTSRSRAVEATRVVGILSEVLHAPSDPAAAVRRLADPATRLVTLTVTEKGYRIDPATGRLRTGDPALRAELAGERPPASVPALLVAGLVRRALDGAPPIAVLSCDNLPGNGKLVARLVQDALALVPGPDAERARAWIEGNAAFPCSMVDRIVPAADADTYDRARRALGVADAAALDAEAFSQWVVEDAFPAGRPAWERAGVIVTGDVTPWELLKLRVLNGAHSTVAYLGAVAGIGTIAEAVELDGMPELLRRLWAEDVAPTLTPPDGVDFPGYCAEVGERFGNPAITHRTIQVAMDGSQKLPQRLVGTALDRLRAGAEPRWAALGVAAWMRFASGEGDGGEELPLSDPLADRVRDAVAGAGGRPAAAVDALLGIEEIFGTELPAHTAFRDLVAGWLTDLTEHGAARTVAALRGGG